MHKINFIFIVRQIDILHDILISCVCSEARQVLTGGSKRQEHREWTVVSWNHSDLHFPSATTDQQGQKRGSDFPSHGKCSESPIATVAGATHVLETARFPPGSAAEGEVEAKGSRVIGEGLRSGWRSGRAGEDGLSLIVEGV